MVWLCRWIGFLVTVFRNALIGAAGSAGGGGGGGAQFVNSTGFYGAASSGTPYTVSTPDGVQDGDLLVASFGVVSNPAAEITAPAGWTSIYSRVHDGGNQVRGQAFYKVASSEPATSEWQCSRSVNGWASLAAFRGVTFGAEANLDLTYTSSIALPAIDVTEGGMLIQAVHGINTGQEYTIPAAQTHLLPAPSIAEYSSGISYEPIASDETAAARTWTVPSGVRGVRSSIFLSAL